jgi:hypothetical protein
MSRADLVDAAFKLYPFRPPLVGESDDAYLLAFIEHVESHDYGLANEIRLGRVQAEWTPDEVNTFKDRMLALPRMNRTRKVTAIPMLGTDAGQWEPTDESMRAILAEFMTMFREWRTETPKRELLPHIAVLMTDGQLLSAPVQRRDRYGSLKMLTQHGPCYGWMIVMDAFMHEITESKQAIKRDVILAHVGTRSLRIVARQNYRYVDGRPEFEPDITEWDLRDTKNDLQWEDPYADLLVSVPEPSGPVS